MGLLIANIILLIVLKDKRVIHDLISLTAVTEDEPKQKNPKVLQRGESDPVVPDVREEEPIENPNPKEEEIIENPEKTEE